MKSINNNVKLLTKLQQKLSIKYSTVKIIYFYKNGRVLDCYEGVMKINKNSLLNMEGYVIIIGDGSKTVEFSMNCFDKNKIYKRVFRLIHESNIYENKEKNSIKIRNKKKQRCIQVGSLSCISLIYSLYWLYLQVKKIKDIKVSRINLEMQNGVKIIISDDEILGDKEEWFCLSEKLLVNKGNFYITKAFSGTNINYLTSCMKKYNKKNLKLGIAYIRKKEKLLLPGKYKCICDPDVTGFLVHEIIGHPLEEDVLRAGRSKMSKMFECPVASKIVTVIDTPIEINNVGSFLRDDCGNKSKSSILIDKGILKSRIKNMRRESYIRRAYPRMSNTYMLPGSDKVQNMINSVEDGYILTNPSYGREDVENLTAYIIVNLVYHIKKGKLTGEYYNNVIISGDGINIFKNIDMISDEYEISGGGFCKKGDNESIKVSCGGPFIKTILELR